MECFKVTVGGPQSRPAKPEADITETSAKDPERAKRTAPETPAPEGPPIHPPKGTTGEKWESPTSDHTQSPLGPAATNSQAPPVPTAPERIQAWAQRPGPTGHTPPPQAKARQGLRDPSPTGPSGKEQTAKSRPGPHQSDRPAPSPSEATPRTTPHPTNGQVPTPNQPPPGPWQPPQPAGQPQQPGARLREPEQPQGSWSLRYPSKPHVYPQPRPHQTGLTCELFSPGLVEAEVQVGSCSLQLL
nr:PREDICTED: proline-rich protein 2-like [Austrofundulus limnaeus]